ncbi:hypothetical protein E2C01_007163 [Portunus trituberculatus]|uniref:Uncharacterized protein n=1 Tax=Portunus trituberculatus TaxID=210409 RepID=A0A5B7CYQ3_PORTR|nr:hypothetical protein [Portunus trituberculatus]
MTAIKHAGATQIMHLPLLHDRAKVKPEKHYREEGMGSCCTLTLSLSLTLSLTLASPASSPTSGANEKSLLLLDTDSHASPSHLHTNFQNNSLSRAAPHTQLFIFMIFQEGDGDTLTCTVYTHHNFLICSHDGREHYSFCD